MASLIILALSAGAIALLWTLFKSYFTRSPLDNIPGPARTSFWRGNQGDLFNRFAWEFHDGMRVKYGPVAKFYGPLGSRGLYVFDPKALNHIIVKDQMIYEEPRWFLSSNRMTFGPSLLATLGEHHRRQRKLLNPVFSINHMRHMTPIFYRVVHRLKDAIHTQIGEQPTEINMLEWMSRTALELVGQAGLGYSFDPLTNNVRNAYGQALKDLQPIQLELHHFRVLIPYVQPYLHPAVVRFLSHFLPSRSMRRYRDIVNIMDKQSRYIYQSKKAALEKGEEAVVQQIGEGKDIMSILMKANLEASTEEKLPEEEILSQMANLIFAATDTTSNALARILQILSEEQDVQDKVRTELLDAAARDEDIPYDTLVGLPYLDAICRESLRLYPPVQALSRETREDIVMPLSEPIQGVNGESISEIPVPKETTIFIGVRASNRNKALWGEDADEFKPERWLSPLPKAVGEAHIPGVYANLMTFLGGGRSCIGFKFSQLEMKVVLAILLRSFKFLPGEKDIYWNAGSVNFPTIGKEGTKSAMYLKLERM
ncbi:hypothetical protein PHLGIDRAFT_122687 [Phlebiopsis gigantea 11061_1 CR5-6]|uniref:Cytochrome P450 n=1 Tax=Phlebiopsis gigantea (strain 11061_1 CR5-6) TaxID=745531 RepID=A0A0C3S023_PHLG1|nr:hypothetical protein PHLGIDRAFT_122687 [Phlebiopsis gigantea 11061_1 CR5-6]